MALASIILTNFKKLYTLILGSIYNSTLLFSIQTCIVCSLSHTSVFVSDEWSSKWQVGNCLMLAGWKADELPLLTQWLLLIIFCSNTWLLSHQMMCLMTKLLYRKWLLPYDILISLYWIKCHCFCRSDPWIFLQTASFSACELPTQFLSI